MNDAYIDDDEDSYRQQQELEEYEYWLYEQEMKMEEANKELNTIKYGSSVTLNDRI